MALGRRLAEVRMRPDGLMVGWVQRSGGPSELVVKELNQTSGVELVATTRPPLMGPHPDGGGSWCWLPDSSGFVYAAADGLWLSAPWANPSVEPRRVVAASEGRHLWGPCVSLDGLMVAFVDESDADACVRVAALDGSWTTTVSRPPDGVDPTQFVLDPDCGDDGLLALHGWAAPAMPWESGWLDEVRVQSIATDGTAVPVRRVSGGSIGQPRWCGTTLSLIDDPNGWRNVHVLDLGEVLTIEPCAVHSEHAEHGGPTWGPGQRTTAWNPAGTAIAYERNEGGFGRLVVSSLDPTHAQETGVTIGRGVHRSLSWATTADGTDRIASIRQGATTPTQVVVYERPASTREWRRVVIARGPVIGWESIDLVEPTVITWAASDGVTIPARLYRPASADPTVALPTLVSIHGGPTDQTRVAWNPRFAAYVAAGWQVLVPDHRGSTGWGRDFQQAMNQRWGDLDVSDTAAGVRYLVNQGLVDAQRVVLSGGSAGGFTVLGLLLSHPALCAAAIVLYPVSDLIALDATTHRFEAHYNQTLVGPRPPHGPDPSDSHVRHLIEPQFDDRYRTRSPIHQLDRIVTPMLIMHGTDDRVVPIEQSDALVTQLQERGVAVDYIRCEGEGHGWSKPDTAIMEHERIMAVLEHLSSGRSSGERRDGVNPKGLPPCSGSS